MSSSKNNLTLKQYIQQHLHIFTSPTIKFLSVYLSFQKNSKKDDWWAVTSPTIQFLFSLSSPPCVYWLMITTFLGCPFRFSKALSKVQKPRIRQALLYTILTILLACLSIDDDNFLGGQALLQWWITMCHSYYWVSWTPTRLSKYNKPRIKSHP